MKELLVDGYTLILDDEDYEAAVVRDSWYRENGIVSNTRLNFTTLEEIINNVG